MLSLRCAQCLVYGGGAAKVEETGELGRWSLERPSPGPAAARRRREAVGEAFAESVALYAESDPLLAVEVTTMGVFLLMPVVEVILRL